MDMRQDAEHPGVQRLRRDSTFWRRLEHEFAVSAQERLHLILILFRLQCARAVDEQPARRDDADGLVEYLLLQRGHHGHVRYLEAPPRIRMSPEGARSGARYIDQHDIAFAQR